MISALLSVVFAFVYAFGSWDLRRLQPRVAAINNQLNVVRFLLISGKPIGEPVAWYGPIVMNTRA